MLAVVESDQGKNEKWKGASGTLVSEESRLCRRSDGVLIGTALKSL